MTDATSAAVCLLPGGRCTLDCRAAGVFRVAPDGRHRSACAVRLAVLNRLDDPEAPADCLMDGGALGLNRAARQAADALARDWLAADPQRCLRLRLAGMSPPPRPGQLLE